MLEKIEMAEKLQSMLEQAEIKLEENEQFKDIPGYDGKYAISSAGRVWSYRRNRFRDSFDKGTGYLMIGLYDNERKKIDNCSIHRLVAEAFVPKPDWWTPGMKLDVGHKDDNRSNNDYRNLYWCSRSQNLDTDHYREASKNKIFSPVLCVETGEVFASMRQAAKAIGKHYYGINLCLLGKQKTCGGYHWERVIEDK